MHGFHATFKAGVQLWHPVIVPDHAAKTWMQRLASLYLQGLPLARLQVLDPGTRSMARLSIILSRLDTMLLLALGGPAGFSTSRANVPGNNDLRVSGTTLLLLRIR